MKTITLVACNRPHYLRQLVHSLKENNLQGYSLFIGVEPVCDAVLRICREIDFMPCTITTNEKPLGVAWNPYFTIKRAFDTGSYFNVHLEDDIVLASDALDLANWFFNLDQNNWFSLNLFNYKSENSRPGAVEESDHFVPLGWGIESHKWRTMLEPNWMCDSRGWDFSVNSLLTRFSRHVLQPKWSRSNHIGREGGVHCVPSWHDRVFSQLSISDGECRDYQLLS